MDSTNKETGRLEAFSDGVFGFAITLLVLDIRVPSVTEGQPLFQALLSDWPTYLAFLTGFFTILICWINHHFMFDYIFKSNSMLLLLNGFKLLVVTFTPFATSLLAKYIPTFNQSAVVSVYAFNFMLMGGSMFGVWYYSYKNNLTKTGVDEIIKTSTRYYFLAMIMSAIIFLLSFANIWICLTFSGLMFFTFLFPERAVLYWTEKRTVSLAK